MGKLTKIVAPILIGSALCLGDVCSEEEKVKVKSASEEVLDYEKRQKRVDQVEAKVKRKEEMNIMVIDEDGSARCRFEIFQDGRKILDRRFSGREYKFYLTPGNYEAKLTYLEVSHENSIRYFFTVKENMNARERSLDWVQFNK